MSEVLNQPVLIVDDAPVMLRIIKKLVSELGFKRVDTALSGAEALELISAQRYCLIFSDWNMQPMTGLELLKIVRADKATENIPFIMVTAESKPANVLAAKDEKVSNYIVKPFTAETLQSKLEMVLGPIF